MLVAAAPSASAGWSADRARWAGSAGSPARSGRSSGWAARDRFTRAPVVLDSARNSVETPIVTYVRDGAFAFAWRRYLSRNHRIRFVTVDRDGRRGATINATTTGESAYDPRWVAGPVPVLAWSRRTRADRSSSRRPGCAACGSRSAPSPSRAPRTTPTASRPCRG
jgi:hypothetical protein